MSKMLVPVDEIINNQYDISNVVYYKSLPNVNSEICYLKFGKNNYVRKALRLTSEIMNKKQIYMSSLDMEFFKVVPNEKIEVFLIPRPIDAQSIIVSVMDEFKTGVVTNVPKKIENKIKNILVSTVANVNNWHQVYLEKMYWVKILTIIDKNKNEMEYGYINDRTQIVVIGSENKSIEFNISSIDFEKIGVGGLEKEFKQLVKNIFITRIIPKNIYDKLNIKHVKGAILYGPPGCGKTRIAKQIGSLIGCKNIKIVNGPELLNKYIGESEKNIRDCFNAAKKNPKELHLLIFDEFDAIAMKRSNAENHVHNNQLVAQLLTMLDGVEEINNLIVFALTNRIDIIDPAILRAGRFSVHIKIDLPDLLGRYEILRIHSKSLIDNKLFKPELDLMEIARVTSNFTGAELESLIQTTVQHVIGVQIDFNNIVESAQQIKTIQIGPEDFTHTLLQMNPMFRKNEEKHKLELETRIKKTFTENDHFLVKSVVDYFRNLSHPTVCCIEGKSRSGKTSIACDIAKQMDPNNIEYVSSTTMLNMDIPSTRKYLKKIFDNPIFSLIILDNIETIIEFVSEKIFNKLILQHIKVLLGDTKHNVVITTSYYEKLKNITVLDSVQFHAKIID